MVAEVRNLSDMRRIKVQAVSKSSIYLQISNFSVTFHTLVIKKPKDDFADDVFTHMKTVLFDYLHRILSRMGFCKKNSHFKGIAIHALNNLRRPPIKDLVFFYFSQV